MKSLIIIILSFVTLQPPFDFAGKFKPASKSETLAAIYTAELGVREASGKNDGKRVEEYLAYVGLKRGDPWCAAFTCWALGQAGIPNPRSGYSPDLFSASRIVWKRTHSTTENPATAPKKGDIFGLFFPEKNRIAHVGFVDHWEEKYATTVEGNTNESGSREGDGVYRKRRLIRTIYAVSRYL